MSRQNYFDVTLCPKIPLFLFFSTSNIYVQPQIWNTTYTVTHTIMKKWLILQKERKIRSSKTKYSVKEVTSVSLLCFGRFALWRSGSTSTGSLHCCHYWCCLCCSKSLVCIISHINIVIIVIYLQWIGCLKNLYVCTY